MTFVKNFQSSALKSKMLKTIINNFGLSPQRGAEVTSRTKKEEDGLQVHYSCCRE